MNKRKAKKFNNKMRIKKYSNLRKKKLRFKLIDILQQFPYPEYYISTRLSKRGKHFDLFVSRTIETADETRGYLILEKRGIRV